MSACQSLNLQLAVAVEVLVVGDNKHNSHLEAVMDSSSHHQGEGGGSSNLRPLLEEEEDGVSSNPLEVVEEVGASNSPPGEEEVGDLGVEVDKEVVVGSVP